MAFVIALIIFIGILVVLSFCVSMIYLIIEYFTEKCGAKLKFKSFKRFYNINPDRWDLDDASVACKCKCNTNSWNVTKEYFYFGIVDHIRYKFWKRNLDKRDKEKAHAQSTARMINSVREDIQKIELLGQQELEQAKKEITYIFYGGQTND